MGPEGDDRSILARLRRARAEDPTAFAVRGVLALLLVLLVVRIAFGPNPWQDGVAERLAEGHKLRPVDYAQTWGWWTAAGIAPVLAALLASMPRWLVRDEAARVKRFARPGPAGRAFLAITAAAMLAGAILALPRMSQSLFEDERYNVRWSIDGFYHRDRAGELRFHEPSWIDTFWYYEWPNNHVPHTILARMSVKTWRAVARPAHRLVSEPALRVPAFLAGLVSIGGIALLGWRLGHPGAGAAAAWLLAVHPWHVRYASEARGYSLALALVPLTLVALFRALHRGTWGRWALFGVAQFLLLWTYPATLWFAVVFNAAAAVQILSRHRGTPALRGQITRWLMANLAGALLWIRLMAPNLAQFAEYLKTPDQEQIDMRWLQDVLSFLFAGAPWGRPTLNENYFELSDLAATDPTLVWAVAAALMLLLLLGLARLLTSRGPAAISAGALLLAPLLMVAAGTRGEAHVHPQYLTLALPGLALFVGVGLETLTRPLGRRGAAATLAIAIVAYAAFTGTQRHELRTRSIQPFRESVELTRPTLDPRAPENVAITTVAFSFPATYYDPRVHQIRSVEQLEAFMREADAEERALFVNLGRPNLAARRSRELMALVRNPELFEDVAFLPGILSRGARQVFRYRGRDAEGRLSDPG
ncbi:MAG: hypothetical protein JRG85_01440 [Deltaproteobacteria bacterium]|nr:hypothetical protein [Deltaproteobacteria bacterium]